MLLLSPLISIAGQQQVVYSSPEEAKMSLVTAVESRSFSQLASIFGAGYKDIDPGDPIERASELDHFANHLKQGVEITLRNDSTAIFKIGSDKWPFPVPLIRKDSGWVFDTKAGRDEILNRRVGRNELLAINACHAYVEAQREYYNLPEPYGVQIPKYAQKLVSSPEARDGLYWPTVPGAKESPLGQVVAKAKETGYPQEIFTGKQGTGPFNGYYFRILKAQGPSAPGGKFSYVINGNMVAGHALIAYPARWGVSGVMTFIVNQRGRIYQKNLGPETSRIAKAMKAYNPDLSWKVVDEQ